MSTDSRTNEPTPEQIVEGVLNRIDLYADELPKAVISSLRAHNLLSEGTPSDAQVEAAVNAAWEVQEFHRGPGGQVVGAPGPVFRNIIRAALVAAQGAAPREERPGRQELGQTIRSRFNDARGRGGVDPWALADLILEEHPALAAPVPQGGVDEDKLAEVIEQARDRSRKDRDISKESLGQYIARIVNERRAEWLEGQGRGSEM